MEPRELLHALMMQHENDDDTDEEEPIREPLVQMLELHAAWSATHEPSSLRPGDFCLEKDGFFSQRSGMDTKFIYMYWCTINTQSYVHREWLRSWTRSQRVGPGDDVILAVVTRGGTVMFRPHTLAHLRPLTHDERAAYDRCQL